MTTPSPPKLRWPGRFLRKGEVCKITSLSPGQLTEKIKNGEFVPPTRLTVNSNVLVWWDADVLAWAQSRLDDRGSPAAQARAVKLAERGRAAAARRRPRVAARQKQLGANDD
jgi:predicted DNA-binding transcriptional regulator AlpA